jgi:DNA-binding MarR family transcriptional regulator
VPASITPAPSTAVLEEIEAALTALTRNPRIRGIHRLLNRESGVELDRPTYVALAMLESGPLRISDLADACDVDVSTMSRLIERLCARGFVERRIDPNDRRAALIQASEGGRAVQRQLRAFREDSLRKLLDGWTDGEREQFAQLLSRFVKGADDLMREQGL